MKLLSKLNLFPLRFRFDITGSKPYTSYFTGILSLCYSVLTLIVLINILVKYFNQEVFRTETSFLNSNQIDLKNLTIAFTILDNSYNFFESPEKIFSVSAFYQSPNFTSEIFVSRCNQNDFRSTEIYNNFQFKMKSNKIDQYFCLKTNLYNNSTILSSHNMSLVNITMNKCSNKTSVICSNTGTIEKSLINSKIHILVESVIIQSSNMYSPGKSFTSSLFYNISFINTHFSNILKYYFEQQIYDSQSQIFSNQRISNNFSKLSLISNELQPTQSDTNILSISLNPTENSRIYLRNFASLIDFFSEIGGINFLMTTIFHLISQFYNDFLVSTFIFEECFPEMKIKSMLFHVNVSKHSFQNNTENYRFDLNKNYMDLTINNRFTETQTKDIIPKSKYLEQIHVSFNKEIQLKWYERGKMCSKSKINKAKLEVLQYFRSNYFSIINLLSLVNQFEGMKNLYFNYEQKQVFEYYVKNNLYFESAKFDRIHILEYLKKINRKDVLTDIDKKLLEYFFK